MGFFHDHQFTAGDYFSTYISELQAFGRGGGISPRSISLKSAVTFFARPLWEQYIFWGPAGPSSTATHGLPSFATKPSCQSSGRRTGYDDFFSRGVVHDDIVHHTLLGLFQIGRVIRNSSVTAGG